MPSKVSNRAPSSHNGTPVVKGGLRCWLLLFLLSALFFLVLQLVLQSSFLPKLTSTGAWTPLVQDTGESNALPESQTNSSRIPGQNPMTRSEDTKPWFVLHIGPPKTGTSSIQAFARQRRKIMTQEDNYDTSMVIQTQPRSKLMVGLKTWLLKDIHKGGQFDLPMIYNRSLAIGAAVGRNIFLSNEHFAGGNYSSDEWIKYRTFLQQHYRIRIVLLYRRYSEWLPSWYNQFFKYEGKYQGRLLKWPPMTEEEENGPNKDAVAIPTFADYFERVLRFEDDDEAARQDRRNPITGKPSHNTVELHRKFRAQGLEVVIQNYHGTDLLTDFFCHSVPEANKMCELAKREGEKQKDKNKSNRDEFDFDLIAVEARRQGLIPLVGKKFSRGNTKKKVREWLAQTPEVKNALPQICMSSAQLSLFQSMSYEFESYMAPYLPPDWILGHNQSFDGAVSKGMFCSVDAKRVLEDERLRNHLRAFANKTA